MDCGRANLSRVRCLLATGKSEKEEVVRSLALLTDAELMSFGLSAYRMNMLSLFGSIWSHDKIRKTAREAAINKLWLGWEYFHHYLPQLSSTSELQLKNFPIELIRAQLARGRGLVIATFHTGHYRYIASDLAIAGIPTCILLDRDSLRGFEGARRTFTKGAFRAPLTAVVAEEIRSCIALSKTLSKGGCVHAMLDGNTGLDGRRGDSHRTEVEILGRVARVKNGLIKMAARCGSPILPILAHTFDGEKECHAAPIIDPSQPLSAEQATCFADRAIHELYRHFSENVLAFPGEWSGCDRFHLWRMPDEPMKQALQDVEQRLMRDLEAGGRATINAGRIIVELSREDDLVWTDVRTMRCYKLPGEMLELVQKLSVGEGGVDADWLARHEDFKRSRMWQFMLQLASRGAIHSHGAEDAVAVVA